MKLEFANLDKLKKLVKDTTTEPQDITQEIEEYAGDGVLPHYKKRPKYL